MTQHATRNTQYAVRSTQHADALIALFCALASLILYAATAAPSVATLFDDSLEFHVILPTLGIAHPSGYPLYTLLGKLFTLLLPFRDPAGRANLLSALAAALTVGLLYLVARRLVGSRPAALTATIAFALSPAWWSQATLAEVYALHGLLVALFLYCLLRWEDDPSAICNLQSAILLFGLGLAHHRMMALLLPAALVFIVWTALQVGGGHPSFVLRRSSFIRLLLCALAPLLLYLYLPLRGQAVGSLDGAFRPTLQGTLDWITARGYSVFLTGNPFGVNRDIGFFAGLFLAQLGALPMIAAVFGLATGWRYGVRRYAFLLLATVAQVAFGVAYKVEDVEVFFIPAFMLIALWAAIGLAPIFDSVALWVSSLGRQARLSRGLRPVVLAAGALAVAAVFLFQPVSDAVRDFPQRDRSHAWDVYDYGQDVLTSVAPGGRIVGLLGETTLARYFRDVLGQRPDVVVVPADTEAARFAAVEAGLTQGQPVYLTRDLPGAATRYSLDAAGPLIAVSPKAKPAPPPAGQALGAGVLLTDAHHEIRQTHAGPVVRLVLTWAAAAPIREELKVSARLLDAAGQAIVIEDRAPVHFTYPTTAWVPGETVRDVYDLRLPSGASPGSYAVLLILYRTADGSEVGRVQLPPILTSNNQ
ncbi:MAG: DUF2723 domain-containing protein [Chloroflexi bacterium]|nr:DUF2723 domain-containing protein [Chloroflexota bacterium]